MTLESAAAAINLHPDFSARLGKSVVFVKIKGRDAGYINQYDLDRFSEISATGWGKHLTRGAYGVWKAMGGGAV